MPCYNDGKYIQESVESVLNQTYENVELIIIDDGSTDAYTNKILIENDWPRTTILHSDRLRPAGARNLGIRHAKGTYILPVDADDRIEPTYVEKAVKILESNEAIGIVYCQADLFGAQRGAWDLPKYSLERMLVDNIIFVTALFRKEDWTSVNGFNEQMKDGMEDYDFWLSLVEMGKQVHQIPEVLFHYRKKANSRNQLFQEDIQKFFATYHQIYENHSDLYNEYKDSYIKGLREAWGYQLILNRRMQASMGYVGKIANIPWVKKYIKKILFKDN